MATIQSTAEGAFMRTKNGTIRGVDGKNKYNAIITYSPPSGHEPGTNNFASASVPTTNSFSPTPMDYGTFSPQATNDDAASEPDAAPKYWTLLLLDLAVNALGASLILFGLLSLLRHTVDPWSFLGVAFGFTCVVFFVFFVFELWRLYQHGSEDIMAPHKY
ncbi:hypothetical protein FB451DRAFT_1395017 [Mycena latifolia]|nr:hypothetical protein FB451DRAFT_1395017 [Mycena latifolia]